MLMKIRIADKDDSYDLWLWRNHPETRKWSFNSREIGYEAHKKWFDEKISGRSAKIYIAENEQGKIGQVRFEITGDKKAYINVGLNPDFFAKGLGNVVIRTATGFFLESHRDIEEVIAEVIKGNIASEKAFEKAGYVKAGEKIKKRRKIGILNRKREMNNDSKD